MTVKPFVINGSATAEKLSQYFAINDVQYMSIGLTSYEITSVETSLSHLYIFGLLRLQNHIYIYSFLLYGILVLSNEALEQYKH